MAALTPVDSDDRGQSEALGVALLVSITIIAAVAVLATGYASLASDQERVGIEQAERALSQLDTRGSEVALGHADAARIDFGLPDAEGTMSTRPDEGWMAIRYTDLTGLADPNTREIANVTLGSVVFSQGDRTVGYQAGGVFRSNGNGSVLVTRPEFHYRDGTLTIPLIRTDGETAISSTVQVTPNGTVQKFPDASRNMSNKVDNSSLVVTVKSRYYQGWAEFFRKSSPGIVTVDPAAQTATVQFISLPDDEGVEGGIIATAESGALALVGTGAYVDSYNSSNGPYASTATGNGTVKAVGNVTISSDATIDGTAASGKWLRVEQSASTVTGDGLYTIDYVNKGTIGGVVEQIDGVPTVLPIDTLVLDRLQDVKSSNNNSEANAIAGVDDIASGLEVTSGESITIGDGRYYTKHMEVEGGTLVLDTTSGNITFAIEDFLKVTKSGGDLGNLTVEGDGVVRVYLTAEGETSVQITGRGKMDLNFFVGKGSTVHIPGDRASRFRVFAPQILQGAIAGDSGKNATFHGLVYAPDGLSLSGSIFTKQANVYGGLVSGQIELGQYGQVHYDKSLEDLLLPRASRISKLEFVHVAIHRIIVAAT